jgi:ATP-dependent DNA helicase RecQ
MDDFINSDTCRRKIPTLFFGNDRTCTFHIPLIVFNVEQYLFSHALTATTDYRLCDNTSPEGCQRCIPKDPTICCDICNPAFFDKYNVMLDRQPRGTGKSVIKPTLAMTQPQAHHELETAIISWRTENTTKKFGTILIRTYGAKLFLPDDYVDQIIICVQAGKISDVTQLIKETGWRSDLAEEYGGSLLTVIHRLVPSAPPTPALAISSQPEPAVQRRKPTCSKCNQEGHISKFYQVSYCMLDC